MRIERIDFGQYVAARRDEPGQWDRLSLPQSSFGYSPLPGSAGKRLLFRDAQEKERGCIVVPRYRELLDLKPVPYRTKRLLVSSFPLNFH